MCAQDFTEALLKIDPELKGTVPEGREGAAKEANDPSKVLISSGAKAERVLGVKYRSVEECSKDSESARDKGRQSERDEASGWGEGRRDAMGLGPRRVSAEHGWSREKSSR